MRLKRRLDRLEEQTGVHPAEVRCPRCRGTDLTEPSKAEFLTAATWPAEDLLQAYRDLGRQARLDWCKQCKRLVVVGEQDPAWRTQFWAGEQGPGLTRNIADLQFVRSVYGEKARETNSHARRNGVADNG